MSDNDAYIFNWFHLLFYSSRQETVYPGPSTGQPIYKGSHAQERGDSEKSLFWRGNPDLIASITLEVTWTLVLNAPTEQLHG
jgi:hypothetical protein